MHLDQLPGSFFGPANLVDLLRHRATHLAGERVFTYLADGESEEIIITYAGLDQRARAIAAELQKKNLVGQRALLLYPAGLDFIAAFFGCMYAGVVAVTAYPPRRNRNMNRIEAIAEDADAKIALTTQESLERVKGFIAETPKLVRIEWLATDKIPANRGDEWRKPNSHGDTLALLQYTSGSTGTPKGVMLNHANLMHNSAMISYAFELTRSGSGVFWLPSYHDMGLIGGILQPMYCGQSNVIFSPAAFLQKPYRWLRAISHYGATISGGPNFAYDLAVDKITDEQLETLDLSSWTLAFNGAEPIHAETLDRFVERFGRCGFRREAFYPCYGLAEATLIVSGGLKTALPVARSVDIDALENHEVVEALRDEEDSRELIGSGGNLLDQKIVIVDPETRTQCPANRVGEIWVAGPSVAQGYWKRPEETETTFRAHLKETGEGPFLRTGDLGFMLEGELFVTGRLKDLIIVRGVNHYPQDIELTVERAHAHLRRNAGAAFTIGDEGRERLVVVQEVRRMRQLDADEVLTAIRKAVAAEHEMPVDAVALIKAGSIPKTSSGKIQRHACRAALLDGSLAVVAQWGQGAKQTAPAPRRKGTKPKEDADDGAVERVAQIVYERVRDIAKERAGELTLDTNIVELGLDSLERMEIVASLEDAFGGRFPEEILPEMETCGQVVEAIEKYMGTEPRGATARAKTDEVPAEYYDFSQFPEYRQLRQTQQMIAAAGLHNPFFKVHEGLIRDTTRIDGRELTNFSSFNYIGTSGDPVVKRAAQEAIDTFGTSVSASRLVSGENTLHQQLERATADFLGTEDCIAMVSGHATNQTVIGHLFGPGDLILHDELDHNSIIQGALLSGARRRPFPHNDWRTCERLLDDLRHQYRRVLVVIEGVYSMDGDFPDLPKFIEIKQKHKALLMVDEAHSLGTMGPHGRGIGEHFDIDPRGVDLWMGTYSKSLGSCGGYIAGVKAVIEYLKYTAPGFVFSVGMSPAAAGAALASLRVLEEEPERVAQLHRNAALFLKLAKEAGLDTGHSRDTPIVPVILGNSQHALELSWRLYERGVNVQPILHPAVEENAARLRFFINSVHNDQQIRAAVAACAEELAQIDPRHLRRQAVNGAATNGAAAKGAVKVK